MQQSHWKFLGFTIGKTNTQGWKKRHFSCYNQNTWSKQGIRDRWSKDPYNGGKDENSFKVMVVLAGYTLNWMKTAKYIEGEGKMGEQHDFALDVERALTTYYSRIRKDKRLSNLSSESGQG